MQQRSNLFRLPVIFLIIALFWFNIPALQSQQKITYHQAMVKGEKELNAKNYLEAKAYFQLALQLKPNDTIASKKVKLIIDKLHNIEIAKKDYYRFIDQGDAFLENHLPKKALNSYRKALKISPGDTYAQNKITQIKNNLEKEKQKLAAYKSLLKKGNVQLSLLRFSEAISLYKKADNLYPGKEAAKNIKKAYTQKKQYDLKLQQAQKLITVAKKQLAIHNYVKALKYLLRADSLFPGNSTLAAKIKSLRPLAQKQIKADVLIKNGDKLYAAKNYMAAKQSYQNAGKLVPGNSYPFEMIQKINILINNQKLHLNEYYKRAIAGADSLFNLKQWNNAIAEYKMALELKPTEKYPRSQLLEISKYQQAEKLKLKARYAAFINNADSLFKISKYTSAQSFYKKALEAKPNATYPSQRLKIIQQKLETLAAAEKINLQYQNAIIKADTLFHNNAWQLAASAYKNAQKLKPNATYPQKQILAINKILKQIQAQKVLNQKFNEAMKLGRYWMKEKNWTKSKKFFLTAQNLNPKASQPKTELTKIDSILNKIKYQQKIDRDFKIAMQSAEDFQKQKNWKKALSNYQTALKLKPDSRVATEKIKNIENILNEIARIKKLNKLFQLNLLTADSLLKQKKYEQALSYYQKASKIKPDKSYPAQQIAKVKNILVKLEKEKANRYNAIIKNADLLLQQKAYSTALNDYETAASIYPQNPYPKKQMNFCRTQLALIAEKNQKLYNKIMTTAGDYFNAKMYDKAIETYRRAHQLIPGEKTAKEKIRVITEYIRNHAVETILKASQTITSNTKKRFSFKPVNIQIRKRNYILIKATNLTGKAFNVLFTYGKNTTRNGGFVIHVPPQKATFDFIIRVGTQYKWFSEDNNWLSVFPENNPIKISLIQISKTD